MRSSRGASYMDQYDDTYDHGGQYDDGNDTRELSTGAKCSKNCLFFVNFLMLLLGIALIVIAIFIKENEEDFFGFGAIDDSIIYIGIACGILIIIISFLGCVGASTNSRCILIIFNVLLILSLILEIVAVIFVFTAADDLKRFAEKQWDSLSAADQQAFEIQNDCCGFETVEGSGCVGCYNTIEETLQANLMIIGWVAVGVAVYQLGMLLFGCILCNKLPPAKYSRV
mmetsp:Transcript_73053/g.116521  ORF Transcript_73053/g.116521 Transcript_73053/m.116521 type:complete len:227 (-) Transcript_73053:208-888(-)|eukprot:CAMPEP_0197029326 /NCGR_PEP_ID=MMETSP1384-20130603/8795_1 /TAXON_ID=29189 /ORGANISM="Ammonia sp." /LENGTH=226 /DNA_ID=CAMNT_0042458467 /DNA_START=43 /DNA_END=723 /DNA_ORIENTATION=+